MTLTFDRLLDFARTEVQTAIDTLPDELRPAAEAGMQGFDAQHTLLHFKTDFGVSRRQAAIAEFGNLNRHLRTRFIEHGEIQRIIRENTLRRSIAGRRARFAFGNSIRAGGRRRAFIFRQ